MIAAAYLEACAAAYLEEVEREKSLRAYAQAYIGFTAAYTGFLFFITDKAAPRSVDQLILFMLTTGAFAFGLCLAIFASRVADYEFPFSPTTIADEIDEGTSLQEFRRQRIADYAVAVDENITVNDKKAHLLHNAAIIFAVGIVLHGFYFIDRSTEEFFWPNPSTTTSPKATAKLTAKPAQPPVTRVTR